MTKSPNVLTLNRVLTLPVITLYGIGTMVGAGIYGLIGKVIYLSGNFTPYAFLLSSFIALFTSLSYGELSSHLPRSAGEAAYVKEGFRSTLIATFIGWLTITTGVVSSSAILSSVVDYFQLFYDVDRYLIKTVIVSIVVFFAAGGVHWSVGIACFFTLIEIGGLVYIIYLGGSETVSHFVNNPKDLLPPASLSDIKTLFLGSFLAFYAFIGFEDMVNMAEEVKSPRKTLHRAILLALLVSSILYILVAYVAVSAVMVEELTKSETPLADLVAIKGAGAKWAISFIGLISLINGGFVQTIMASRVLYGMSRQRMAPKIYSYIYPKTKTPLVATVTVGLITWVLMVVIPHVTLAKITTFIILIIFSAINLSLIFIKRRNQKEKGVFRVPMFVPYAGLILNLSLLAIKLMYLVMPHLFTTE
ncbi:MAG: APC family permease [Chlamydiota bacterium]